MPCSQFEQLSQKSQSVMKFQTGATNSFITDKCGKSKHYKNAKYKRYLVFNIGLLAFIQETKQNKHNKTKQSNHSCVKLTECEIKDKIWLEYISEILLATFSLDYLKLMTIYYHLTNVSEN